MVYNRRSPIKAKQVLVNITAPVADVTAAQFTANPFWNFWAVHYGTVTPTYVNLGFPTGVLTVADLPFDVSATAFDRLDMFAKDLTITPPKIDVTKETYLGSADATGSVNSALFATDPDMVNVKITLSGGASDLLRFRASAVTSPTGYSRFNFGNTGAIAFGLAILVSTHFADPTNVNAVTTGYFINNCVVVDSSDLSKGTADGKLEATFEITGLASSYFGEVFTAQHGTAHNSTVN